MWFTFTKSFAMSGGRRMMIWTIVAGVIVAIAVAGLLVDRHHSRQSLPVMRAVPQQTVALLRPLEMKQLSGFLRKNPELLGKLEGIPLTAGCIRTMKKLDSALEGQDQLMRHLSQREMVLALVKHHDSASGILFLMEVGDMMQARSLGVFLSDLYTVVRETEEIHGKKVHRIQGEPPFYYLISRGVLCGSRFPELLRMAVEQQAQKTGPFPGQQRQEIIATSGKNVDANVYLNIREFLKLSGTKVPLGDQWDFAALDLMMKEDGLMLNGFFLPGKEEDRLSGLFSGSPAVLSACPDVLPAGTREFYQIGFTHFDSLCAGLSAAGLSGEGGAHAMSEFERKHFRGWSQGELTVAWLPGSVLLAAFKASPGSDPLGDLQGITSKSDRWDYQGVDIRTVYREGMIRDLLSPFSDGMTLPYFCNLGDHIVFCSSLEGLQDAILGRSLGKTLQNSQKYRAATVNISHTSHLYHYLDLEEALEGHGSPVLREAKEAIVEAEEQYRHFPVFSSQYTLAGEWYYAGLSLAFLDSLATEEEYLWKADLRSEPVKGPMMIQHPLSDDHYLFVGTKDGITLLSSSGIVIWEKDLAEEVVGQPVMVAQESEPWIFLNTATQLHKINLRGENAAGFPVSLESTAATGLKLLHYPDTREYRILIPGQDRKIYNFDAEGRKVKGWKEPELPGTPTGLPQYLAQNKKDYLVFSDEEGNILITDRRGKERVRYKGDFTNADNSGLFLNRTNSRGLFITTDTKGHLVYIPEKGRIQKTVFGDFSQNHYFFYTDINGDGHEDFIFFDERKVKVFDRFKNVLFNTDLPEYPSSKPIYIARDSKQKFFLFRGGSGMIYQVDNQGKLKILEERVTDSGFATWKDPETGIILIALTKTPHLLLYPL